MAIGLELRRSLGPDAVHVSVVKALVAAARDLPSPDWETPAEPGSYEGRRQGLDIPGQEVGGKEPVGAHRRLWVVGVLLAAPSSSSLTRGTALRSRVNGRTELELG